MISLSESYRELLTEEEAKVMLITQAIRNKWVCTIRYLGDEQVPGGWRDIEPVCLGFTKAGNLAVRAWQKQGDSKTPHNLPFWRLFRLDRVAQVKTNKIPFTQARPKFNKSGDRTMRQVLLIAKF
jgi:predicted DNA-binding transcriptional regulator YafY